MKINWLALIAGIAGSAIDFVEQIHAPGQGATKFGMAVNITQTAATVAAAAGILPGGFAADIGKISKVVQDTFDHKKAAGTLAPAPTAQEQVQATQDTTAILD